MNHPVRYLLTVVDVTHAKRLGDRHPPMGAKEATLAKRLIQTYGLDRVLELVESFFASDDPWIEQVGRTFCIFSTQISKLISAQALVSRKASGTLTEQRVMGVHPRTAHNEEVLKRFVERGPITAPTRQPA